MPLSKTQIALYTTLTVATFVVLSLQLPHWLLIVFVLCVGIAELVLERPRSKEQEQPPDLPWPWHTGAFWIVLVLFGLLAGALALAGAPAGIIALVCGVGVIFYGYDVGKRIKSKRRQLQGRRSNAAGVQEWTLLGSSTVLCLTGLLTVRYDWRTTVVTVAFFGSCGLLFLTNILRRRREQQWMRSTVRVSGGVNIYLDAVRLTYIAFVCCFLGAVMWFVGINHPLPLRLLGAFIGFVGIGLGTAIALGFFSRQFIRFEPDAFVIGERRYRARIEWENIAAVAAFEYADNPFVGIALWDAEGVRVEPAAGAAAFLSFIGQSRALMGGADLAIASRNFGIDNVVLAGALQRYATQPHARQELVSRDRLTAPGMDA